MGEILDLDIKVQLLNEFLRNGGTEKINDADMLREIMEIQFDDNGKAIPETIGAHTRGYMMILLNEHAQELPAYKDSINEYPSLLQKSFSFDQFTIKTTEEFDVFYAKFADQDNVLFRGQREASWRLMNRLQREWILKSLGTTEEEYLILLQKLAANGLHEHSEEIKDILGKYNIDSINDIAVLGYLQHHGCPTPLLDWTYSLDVALYFALDGLEENTNVKEISDYFSIYYLEEEHFAKGGYRELLVDSMHTLSEEFKDKAISFLAQDEEMATEMKEHFKDRSFFDKSKYYGSGMVNYMTQLENIYEFPVTFFSDKDIESGVIFSLHNSKNIQSQRGAFVWNSSPYKPLDIAAKDQYLMGKEDGQGEDFRFCRCANIHKDLKKHVEETLAKKGITKKTIYTSIDINTWPVFEQAISK